MIKGTYGLKHCNFLFHIMKPFNLVFVILYTISIVIISISVIINIVFISVIKRVKKSM